MPAVGPPVAHERLFRSTAGCRLHLLRERNAVERHLPSVIARRQEDTLMRKLIVSIHSTANDIARETLP